MDFSTAFATGLASGQQRLQQQQAHELDMIRLNVALAQSARQDELFPYQRDKLAAESQALRLDAELKKQAQGWYSQNGGGLLGAMGANVNPPGGGQAPGVKYVPNGGMPGSGAWVPSYGQGQGGAPATVRSNNPGAIMPGGQMASYPNPQAGATALDSLLTRAYTPQQGIATLTQLFSKYAPAGHGNNNPQAYAATVGQRLGIGPNDPIDTTDPQFRAALMNEIARVEGGQGAGNAFNLDLFQQAARLPNSAPPQGLTPYQAGNVQVAQNNTNTATDAAGPPQRQPGAGVTAADVLNPAYIAKLTEAAMHPNPYIAKEAKDKLAVVESIRKAQTPTKMDGMQWFQSRFGRDPNTDQEWALVKRYNQDNSSQSVNVNMPPEADETAKQQGKTLNESRAKINSEAEAAVKTMAALHYAEPLVNASGSLADMRKAVGGLLYLAGADPNGAFAKQIQEAQDINTLQALAAKLMLPIVQGTAGFHSNFSNTDLQTIMSMNVSPQNLPEVNRRLIALAREEAQLALEKGKHFKGMKDYADYENRLADWNEKIAARYPANPPASASPGSGTGNASTPPAQYKTPDDVKREYQAGKLTKDQAAAILQNAFGME